MSEEVFPHAKCSQCKEKDVPAGGTIVICEDCEKSYTLGDDGKNPDEEHGTESAQIETTPAAEVTPKNSHFNCCCQMKGCVYEGVEITSAQIGGFHCSITGNAVGRLCMSMPVDGDPSLGSWSCLRCAKGTELATNVVESEKGHKDNSTKLHRESFTTGGSK